MPGGGKVWTLGFIALLGYVWTIHSYKAPIGSIVVATALVAVLLQGRKPRFPAPLLWFGAYLLWSTMGGFFSLLPDTVWEILSERWKVWLIFFATVNLVRSPSQVRLFIIFYLGCFALYPVRGTIVNVLIHEPGPRGRYAWNFVFNNPNDLATYCVLYLGMTMIALQSAIGRWQRLAAVAGVVLLPIVILLTQSRAGFLGLTLTGTLVLLQARPNAKMVMLGLVAVAGVAIAAPPEAWERIEGLRKLSSSQTVAEADPEGSAEQRYTIWKVARAIAADHPIWGVGIGTYPQVHAMYAVQLDEWRPARGKWAAHNTFLSILAETGGPGLLLFIAMLASVIRTLRRTAARIRESTPVWANDLAFMQASLWGFILCATFGVYSTLPYLYFVVAIAWLLSNDLEQAALRLGPLPKPT